LKIEALVGELEKLKTSDKGRALEELMGEEHVREWIHDWLRPEEDSISDAELQTQVNRLIEYLKNFQKSKSEICSQNEISAVDAVPLFLAQALTDVAGMSKLAAELWKRIAAADRPDFALGLCNIKPPDSTFPDPKLWLELIQDENVLVAGPVIMETQSVPPCDPEKLFLALDGFEQRLTAAGYIDDEKLIERDYMGDAGHARRKLFKLADDIIEGDLPFERLVRMFQWRGGSFPHETLNAKLDKLKLKDAKKRNLIIDIVKQRGDFHFTFLPALYRGGVTDADRDWVMSIIDEKNVNYASQFAQLPDKSLRKVFDWILAKDTKHTKSSKEATFNILRSMTKENKRPKLTTSVASDMLEHKLKDFRVNALIVLAKVAEQGEEHERIAKAIVKFSQRKKILFDESYRLKHIQTLLPAKVLKKAKEDE